MIEKLKQTATMNRLHFDEKKEDRKIRENMRIMSLRSRHILSANFHVPTFHHVSVSFPHV